MNQTVNIITPRTFATRRIAWNKKEYEAIANRIKKYGCPVSKVSDFYDQENDPEYKFATVFYFEIPVENKEAFIKEENVT